MKFRPYSEYKDSGVEWFGKIPKEWDISILGAHISTIVPMRDKPTSFDGNIPWIGSKILKANSYQIQNQDKKFLKKWSKR